MELYNRPEWNALLADVCAAPELDLPRLIAADWLEDHGDVTRAMFIRLQCQLAGAEAVIPERELKLAKEHERKLQRSVDGILWWALEACPGFVRWEFNSPDFRTRTGQIVGSEQIKFHRGFPQAIICSASDWLAHADGVIQRQPIEHVSLYHCEELQLEHWWSALDSVHTLKTLTVDVRREIVWNWLKERLPQLQLKKLDSRYGS